MPRQNRVDPLGRIMAVSARGSRMGNRGCLHDAQGRVLRQWARKAWVICLLDFKGRRRTIMAPGRYTELFFLDEATALAAGHRPCGTCQRERYRSFLELWNRIHAAGGKPLSIGDVDRQLHAERIASGGESGGWQASIRELPDGVFVLRNGSEQPWLLKIGRLHPWSPEGYGKATTAHGREHVRVVTPSSTVAVLKAGYLPQIHPTLELEPGKRSDAMAPMGAVGVEPQPAASDADVLSGPMTCPTSEGVSSSGFKGGQLHRLSVTPSGKSLFTYFAAILRVTGMDEGAVYPLDRFLKNFSGHIKAGRIERVADGYRLTSQGRDYFAARYRPGNRQHVEEGEVQEMVRLIRNGGEGWVRVKD